MRGYAPLAFVLEALEDVGEAMIVTADTAIAKP